MKLERHSKIVELIGKYEIETQEELAEHLKQAGYKVTQATVSRDIPGTEADEGAVGKRAPALHGHAEPDRLQ